MESYLWCTGADPGGVVGVTTPPFSQVQVKFDAADSSCESHHCFC